MVRFALSQLRFRRVRVASLAGAILVTAVSFTLLAATTKTSSLEIKGTLKSNFRPAYDILVRPPKSLTALERRQRLVRPNYLSGIFGGITVKQWRAIERVPGVDVAAPVANLGYFLQVADVPINLSGVLDPRTPYALYRIDFSFVADAGRSRYPAGTGYVFYAPQDHLDWASGPGYLDIRRNQPGPPQRVCDKLTSGVPSPATPFEQERRPWLMCLSHLGEGDLTPQLLGGRLPRTVLGVFFQSRFPTFVAAIDPREEARLLHLDRTIVSGRYLTERDRAVVAESKLGSGGFGVQIIPLLASIRTFVREDLRVRISRLDVAPGTNVPRLVSEPGGMLFPHLRRLPARAIARRTYPFTSAYQSLVRGMVRSPTICPICGGGNLLYWTPGSTRYRSRSGTLEPLPVPNPKSIWTSPVYPGGWFPPPPDNQDVQFRPLQQHQGSSSFRQVQVTGSSKHISAMGIPFIWAIGRYDPLKLPSFSPLSKVPLETYYPPELLPATNASRAALHGQPLLPTQNLGDYIQQPPLLLTTLDAIRPYFNRRNFTGPKPHGIISAIRVRVAGVKGPDPLSLTRIRVVAQKIHDATGLAVDITAGSSPHPLLVDLPAGRFGRPRLVLREGWSKKGVTLSFLRALDRKDLALFILVLVICGSFLGNAVFAVARARRAEVGILTTIGWSRGNVFAAVLGEVAVVGVVAGAAGVAVAAIVAVLLSLHLALVETVLVLPIAVLLALVSGVLPALLAARAEPLDALRQPVSLRATRSRVRTLRSLAFVNLRRLPLRTFLGGVGLFLGVAALAVLLAIQHAFQGTLVGTVLGSALSLQVRGADFAAVGLTLGLAALSVADVLYLNLRERAAEIVTLRTLGWSERQLGYVILAEALGVGLLGAGSGAVVGFALGAGILAVPAEPLAAASVVAAAGGVLAALLASVLPLRELNRLPAPSTLAAE